MIPAVVEMSVKGALCTCLLVNVNSTDTSHPDGGRIDKAPVEKKNAAESP